MFESLASCFAFRCSAWLNMTTSPSRAENCLPRYNLSYECTLEFVSNVTRVGRGAEGFDVRSNFPAWDHCLSCDTGDSADRTQTLTLAQDSFRRRPPRDSGRGTFARHQWFGSLFCHTRRRRGSGGDPSPVRVSGILFSWVWDFGQRQARCDRARWKMRFSHDATQSRLNA